jgi:hypothetical protein
MRSFPCCGRGVDRARRIAGVQAAGRPVAQGAAFHRLRNAFERRFARFVERSLSVTSPLDIIRPDDTGDAAAEPG